MDRNGVVIAKANKGRCRIYARAHNGRKSNNIILDVENYAKPNKDALDLGEAYRWPQTYGFVLELFENHYNSTTDIAEYFYINRPVGSETFECWMEDEEIKMQPESFLVGTIKQKIYSFVKDFPYDIRIYVTSDYVKFIEMEESNEGIKADGPTVTFLYDRYKHDPKFYDEKHEMAANWTYGFFVGR